MSIATRTFLCFSGILCLFLMFKREGEVDGWEKTNDRNVSLYIDKDKMTSTILPKSFCDQQCFVLIIVTSAPNHTESRSAIRETWGSTRNVFGYNLSLYFLLAKTHNSSVQKEILEESDNYGDIIQEYFIDSYNNLTLKSLAMLKLVTKKCLKTTQYLLKIDDDNYLNVFNLVEELIRRNGTRKLLLGNINCPTPPTRDWGSKWYLPKYLFENEMLPTYLGGPCYLMSMDVANKLFLAAFTIPLMPLEDVFVTGLCALKAKIELQNNKKFRTYLTEVKLCHMNQNIVSRLASPQRLKSVYKVVSDQEFTQKCRKFRPTFIARIWHYNNYITRKKCEKICKVMVLCDD